MQWKKNCCSLMYTTISWQVSLGRRKRRGRKSREREEVTLRAGDQGDQRLQSRSQHSSSFRVQGTADGRTNLQLTIIVIHVSLAPPEPSLTTPSPPSPAPSKPCWRLFSCVISMNHCERDRASVALKMASDVIFSECGLTACNPSKQAYCDIEEFHKKYYISWWQSSNSD